MSTTIQVTIVSPTSLVYEGQASMVEIPGTEGDFSAMPMHAPVLSRLREGMITLVQPGQPVRRFMVKDGYADVSAERCMILSEEVVEAA